MKNIKYFFTFCISLWILYYCLIDETITKLRLKETFSKYNIVFSINVHEKPEFLLTQLKNIKEYVDTNYVVILNCNKNMYDFSIVIGVPSGERRQ